MVDKQEWPFHNENPTIFILLVYARQWKVKVREFAARRINCHGAKYAHHQIMPAAQHMLR